MSIIKYTVPRTRIITSCRPFLVAFEWIFSVHNVTSAQSSTQTVQRPRRTCSYGTREIFELEPHWPRYGPINRSLHALQHRLTSPPSTIWPARPEWPEAPPPRPFPRCKRSIGQNSYSYISLTVAPPLMVVRFIGLMRGLMQSGNSRIRTAMRCEPLLIRPMCPDKLIWDKLSGNFAPFLLSIKRRQSNRG